MMESVVFSVIADHSGWHYSNTSLFSLSSTIITSPLPDTVFMVPWEELEMAFIALCLEGFFYGKNIYILCALTCTLAKESPIIPRSRTLFRNIRHVFTSTLHIEQAQDGNHPFLCPLSSLRSIYCYRCQ